MTRHCQTWVVSPKGRQSLCSAFTSHSDCYCHQLSDTRHLDSMPRHICTLYYFTSTSDRSCVAQVCLLHRFYVKSYIFCISCNFQFNTALQNTELVIEPQPYVVLGLCTYTVWLFMTLCLHSWGLNCSKTAYSAGPLRPVVMFVVGKFPVLLSVAVSQRLSLSSTVSP